MARTASLSFRVEPETARALTWITNKHNYDNNDTLTKTDVIVRLINLAVIEPDILISGGTFNGTDRTDS